MRIWALDARRPEIRKNPENFNICINTAKLFRDGPCYH